MSDDPSVPFPPSPSIDPIAPPPTPVTTVARPARASRGGTALNGLLVVASLVAVGGIAFGIGRATAATPAASTAGRFGAGAGSTGRGERPGRGDAGWQLRPGSRCVRRAGRVRWLRCVALAPGDGGRGDARHADAADDRWSDGPGPAGEQHHVRARHGERRDRGHEGCPGRSSSSPAAGVGSATAARVAGAARRRVRAPLRVRVPLLARAPRRAEAQA